MTHHAVTAPSPEFTAHRRQFAAKYGKGEQAKSDDEIIFTSIWAPGGAVAWADLT
jgi:hypothetical protein